MNASHSIRFVERTEEPNTYISSVDTGDTQSGFITSIKRMPSGHIFLRLEVAMPEKLADSPHFILRLDDGKVFCTLRPFGGVKQPRLAMGEDVGLGMIILAEFGLKSMTLWICPPTGQNIDAFDQFVKEALSEPIVNCARFLGYPFTDSHDILTIRFD
jgi:hypothetical protein